MKYDYLTRNLPALQSRLTSYGNVITLGDVETARAIYCVANELAELNRKLDILTNALKNK